MRATPRDRTAVNGASRSFGRLLRRLVYTAAAACGFWLLTALLHTSSASAKPVTPPTPVAPMSTVAKSVSPSIAGTTRLVRTATRSVTTNPLVKGLAAATDRRQTPRVPEPARGIAIKHTALTSRAGVVAVVKHVAHKVVGEVVRPVLRRTVGAAARHLVAAIHIPATGLPGALLPNRQPPLRTGSGASVTTPTTSVMGPTRSGTATPGAAADRDLGRPAGTSSPARPLPAAWVPAATFRHMPATTDAPPHPSLPRPPVPAPIPMPVPAGGGIGCHPTGGVDQPAELGGSIAAGPSTTILGRAAADVHVVVADQAEPPVAPD